MIQCANLRMWLFGNLFRAALSIALVGLFFSTTGYADDNYPNTTGMGGEVAKDSEWYTLCIRAKDAQPPKTDLPPVQTISALNGCIPTDLYYEAKSKLAADNADWEKVKDCAFSENDNEVLMMLYANGFGVKRNINLAIKHACKLGGAPAEVWSRVPHLAGISNEREDIIFDVCDDITSTNMMRYCASIPNRQAELRNLSLIKSLLARWDTPERIAFNTMYAELSNFARIYGYEEINQDGTIIPQYDEYNSPPIAHLLSKLEEFEAGNLPDFSETEFKELDAQLNQLYREIMGTGQTVTINPNATLGDTTITRSGIKMTQRAWLKYRDALVKFGRTRYPTTTAHTWKAFATSRRIDNLETLLSLAQGE